jgi:hypothetical protein
MVRVLLRRTLLVLVGMVAGLTVPVVASAQAPLNDAPGQAASLQPAYGEGQVFPTVIAASAMSGGWSEATTESDDPSVPTCLGSLGFHSMWYALHVDEASVLTVLLKSSGVDRYQPVVTILTNTFNEIACGLGGTDVHTDPGALASSYVPRGDYYIRIASVSNLQTTSTDLPTVTLFESLRDVTPPQIRVSVSGKAKIVGVGKTYTFDASQSVDNGSGVNDASAVWEFYDSGRPTERRGALLETYAWKTPGLHRVTLTLADLSKNKNTYSFDVLVHNFVPPKVGLRVFPPIPGSRMLRVVLTHDVPVRVRLVIMQSNVVLRAIPSRLVTGSNVSTSFEIPLRGKVSTGGFVVVSGVASDLGQFPNTVPLLTCSLDPVHGGGVCA